MRKRQNKMPTKAEKISKNSTLILLGTVSIFFIQAIWLSSIKTDYSVNEILIFCICEMSLLILTFFPGLKNKQTRFFLLLVILVQSILFFLDKPIESSEVLFLIIFPIRFYVLILLFNTASNKFYSAKQTK